MYGFRPCGFGSGVGRLRVQAGVSLKGFGVSVFGASSGFAVVFGKAIGFVALVQKDWVVTCCDKGFHKGSMKVLTGLGFRV